MKKTVRNFKVDFNFDWTYGVDIKKLREDLDALEKLGVTRIDIETETFYDTTSITIEAYIERMETDEECAARISFERKKEEELRKRELEQFNRLKLKYGR